MGFGTLFVCFFFDTSVKLQKNTTPELADLSRTVFTELPQGGSAPPHGSCFHLNVGKRMLRLFLSMVEVVRGILKSSSHTLLLKQGQPEQIAQDHVQLGFQYLQGRRLHSFSGKPVPALDYHHFVFQSKVFLNILLTRSLWAKSLWLFFCTPRQKASVTDLTI